MDIQYSISELLWYLMIYSLLGWAVEVLLFALIRGKFVNRGLLNLPFALPYGITAVILMLALPPLDRSPVRQFFLCWVIFRVVWSISSHFVRRISRAETEPEQYSHGKAALITASIALAFLIQYLLIHPMLLVVFAVLPGWLIRLGAVIFAVLVCADFACVLYTLHTSRVVPAARRSQATTQRLADKMTSAVWHRLQKAYPNIENAAPGSYVFAEGLCFDKLVWVFLSSSFLGALIEMVFCRATGGVWMNRSSVLYGAFSFVWGFGAVVLTVTLRRFTDKPDRHVFLAGFVIGGAYEYLCSVFTEIVFGTVFWDYSHMPLNIGGRTNVLYCVFWGLLAVLWLRVLYPPMEKTIQRIPPLTGKVITWIIVALMLCDGLLTGAAMLRYTERQTSPESANIVEAFLDERYPDDYMEERWPNMIVTE